MFIGTNVHSIDFFTEDPINEAAEEGAHVNTWDDWHLVATSRPTISLPKFQENNVEITGMNGFVDVSRVLTGYPLYGARTGSIEFLILNQYNINNADYWTQTYHKVAHFLHGQRRKMVLHDDERNYYYDGVFTVDSFEPGENNSTITINYVLQPFKKARRLSDEEWIWDPFDLDYGITMNRLFKDVEVNIPIPESGTTQEWDEYDISDYVGEEPVVPIFYVTIVKQPDSGSDTRTFVYPDVNNDGKIDSMDASDVLDAYIDLSTGGAGFYDKYEKVRGLSAPTFETDTYYKYQSNEYVLLETEPADWSTNWTDYYTLYTAAEQFDRADADRNGKVNSVDATSYILPFYTQLSTTHEYPDTPEGWAAFMGDQPVLANQHLKIDVYARTIEGRVTSASLDVCTDGTAYGSDDITIIEVKGSETETTRTFKVTCPHVVLYGEYVMYKLQGVGSVSISFREGRL